MGLDALGAAGILARIDGDESEADRYLLRLFMLARREPYRGWTFLGSGFEGNCRALPRFRVFGADRLNAMAKED